MKDYDVIVVGAGAAGGTVAGVLSEKGKRVLLLEKGRAQGFADERYDHLRNHRHSPYGHNTGPSLEGNPRVLVEPDGIEKVLRPHENGYSNNASCVGGGTLVYGAQAWRFHPDDFRLASRYGIPHESSLADWPISYEDLAPYYERAEWEIGVSGDAASHTHMPRRRKDLPMPPVPDNPQRLVLKAGAKKLGWDTGPVPLLINTRPYLGRESCAQCGMCVGFTCPNDSKNGTQNTLIPRALATGRCDLRSGVTVTRILTEHGKVSGLSLVMTDAPDSPPEFVSADSVVLCAGAVESARLLLLSAWDKEPNGMGNTSDQVGRHLQGHVYAGAIGLMPEPVQDNLGPGVSISTTQFNHGNAGVIGGAMLANEFVPLPIIYYSNSWPPGLKRWGLEGKRAMRHNYRRSIQVQGPIQEIPNPISRITLDKNVKDSHGLPVARLSGSIHPETLKTAAFMQDIAMQWLQASQAEQYWKSRFWPGLSAGQHQAGTCRMGTDPRHSVTDAFGKVHGHENLYVADASLHVSNGGFNPVLTIMAMAFRVADKMAA